MRRDKSHITRRILSLKVDRCRRRGKSKKTWVYCVRNDMCIKSLNTEMQLIE